MTRPWWQGPHDGDPQAQDEDDRDIMDMTREERQARYHELTSLELIEIIELAIESVDGLRHDVSVLKRELGRVL